MGELSQARAQGRGPRPGGGAGGEREEQGADAVGRRCSNLRAGGVFGYRANGMRRGRRPSVVTPILLVSALAAVAATPRAAPAGAFRLVDGEGVVHLTDVPADPRYRAFPGSSGTTAGWLRLPLRRWAEYADDIQNLSRLHGVPAALIESVIRTESAFDPTAVSPKGAGGLMQLMPQTAAALGVTNRFDPQENIGGGVRHLRYLLDRYHGNARGIQRGPGGRRCPPGRPAVLRDPRLCRARAPARGTDRHGRSSPDHLPVRRARRYPDVQQPPAGLTPDGSPPLADRNTFATLST